MGNAKTKYMVCYVNITQYEKVTEKGFTKSSEPLDKILGVYNSLRVPRHWRITDDIVLLVYTEESGQQFRVTGWKILGDMDVQAVFIDIEEGNMVFRSVTVSRDGREDHRNISKFGVTKLVDV